MKNLKDKSISLMIATSMVIATGCGASSEVTSHQVLGQALKAL